MNQKEWKEIYEAVPTGLIWIGIKDCLNRIESNSTNQEYCNMQKEIILGAVEVLSTRV